MNIVDRYKKRSRPCPDCGSALVRRSSAQVTPLIMKTFLFCKNPVCGASFAGLDEITNRVSPPSNPNPNIHLPMSMKNSIQEIYKSLNGNDGSEPNNE